MVVFDSILVSCDSTSISDNVRQLVGLLVVTNEFLAVIQCIECTDFNVLFLLQKKSVGKVCTSSLQ